MRVPDQSEVDAAWHALPAKTRDRIGIIAVDLVFQASVHGDAYVATGSPMDRVVPGRSKAARAIRDTAAEAESRCLNELHPVVETALLGLFGPEGENPSWASIDKGSRRSAKPKHRPISECFMEREDRRDG